MAKFEAYDLFNDSNIISAAPVKVEFPEILEAYFAERKTVPEFEEKTEIYTVVSGDNLSKIAAKYDGVTIEQIKKDNKGKTGYSRIVDNHLDIGWELDIKTQKETGIKISFEYIRTATVGKEVYIVVESKRFQGKEIQIDIHQGKEKVIADKDTLIEVMQGDEVKLIKTKIGEVPEEEGETILNKEDFKDWGIAKVKLRPKEEETLKTWNEDIGKKEGKKTCLYLLVDAHSLNEEYGSTNIVYYGANDGGIENSEGKVVTNYWLDEEDRWFELKSCSCCQFTVDADGFIEHDDIAKEQVTEIEQGSFGNPKDDIEYIVLHRTVTSDARSTIDNAFKKKRGGVYYGTHFLVGKDGKMYQTASLNKYTYHVKGKNGKSIGIEVVGMPLDKDGNTTIGPPNGNAVASWEVVSKAQAQSVACIIKGLLNHYELKVENVESHEDLQAKTEGEGRTVYDAVINLIK